MSFQSSDGFSPAASSAQNPERRLALYQAVSRAVNSSLILEDIFNALAAVLAQYIQFESGRIVVFDDTQNNLKMVIDLHRDGRASIQPVGPVFIASDSVMKQLHQGMGVLHLGENNSQESFCLARPEKHQLIAPLALKGMLIGGLSIGGNRFDQDDEAMLSDISSQLSVAIENARLYWQTQNQAVQQFLLNQITHAIRKALKIEDILKTTVKEVGLILGASRCLVHFDTLANTPEANPEVRPHSDSATSFQYTMPGTPPVGNPTQWAELEKAIFERRQPTHDQYNPYIVNNTSSGSLFQDELLADDVKSFAVFPILIQQQDFVGTISLHQCNVTRAWLVEDIDLMRNIAEHLALALYQARLYEEAQTQREQLKHALEALQETQLHLVQSEKMAVLGQFVAGIAHEVNTPLGIIVANEDTTLQCLKKIQDTAAKSPDTAKHLTLATELLQLNQQAAERIGDIVHNLRNFARLDESDLKLANIHDGLDTTLKLVLSGLSRKDLHIDKDYGPLPLVECFPGLLNQVFQNVLINAIQAIGDTPGGRIQISTHYDESAQRVQIAIRDNGKGIAPEHVARIFDPGFTTKGVGVGTGLGLALCFNILKKHGGRIWADSVVGDNSHTTLFLELPISPEPTGDPSSLYEP